MSRTTGMQLLSCVGCTLAIVVGAQSVSAQADGRERPGGVLQRLDANGDGVLQPEEVPQRARPLIRRIAERAGLDPNGPLPLDRLSGSAGPNREGDDRSNGDRIRRTSESGDSEERDDRERRGSRDRGGREDEGGRRWRDGDDDDRPRQRADALPLKVPGFGIDLGLVKVPGFEVPHSVTSQSGPTLAELEQTVDGRTMWFARRVLERADENGNQIVDPAEWERLRWRGDANELDVNKDGRLTLPELIQGIARQREESRSDRNGDAPNRAGSNDSPGESGQSPSGPAAATDNQAAQQGGNSPDAQPERGGRAERNEQERNERQARRSAARNRRDRSGRSDGPSWFRSRDRNRDGQVSMSEYAARWDDRIVAEFTARDSDGDGVITLREAAR